MDGVIGQRPTTSNEELQNLQPGQNAVRVYGAIVRKDPRRQRADTVSRVKLFRCIFSNQRGSELRVLFWEHRATEYEGTIVGKMVEIYRPGIVLANPMYADPSQNLLPIELSIQRNTTITIHGPIPGTVAVIPVIDDIELSNVGRANGVVRLVGFVRIPFERQTLGNVSFGSGSLTDGMIQLCVNITNFDEHGNPGVGCHVRVQGEVRRNRFGTIILQVNGMEDIVVASPRVMTANELENGYRAPQQPADNAGAQQGAIAGVPPQINNAPAPPIMQNIPAPQQLALQQQVQPLPQVAQQPVPNAVMVPPLINHQAPPAPGLPVFELGVQQQAGPLPPVAQQPVPNAVMVPPLINHQAPPAPGLPVFELGVQQQARPLPPVPQQPVANAVVVPPLINHQAPQAPVLPVLELASQQQAQPQFLNDAVQPLNNLPPAQPSPEAPQAPALPLLELDLQQQAQPQIVNDAVQPLNNLPPAQPSPNFALMQQQAQINPLPIAVDDYIEAAPELQAPVDIPPISPQLQAPLVDPGQMAARVQKPVVREQVILVSGKGKAPASSANRAQAKDGVSRRLTYADVAGKSGSTSGVKRPRKKQSKRAEGKLHKPSEPIVIDHDDEDLLPGIRNDDLENYAGLGNVIVTEHGKIIISDSESD